MSARIVIVGAGFAGLETARRLAGVEAEITLIDRHNYHLFQPLLYQVATAALSPADIAWPIRRLLRDKRNVRVVMGRVTGVDAQAREVLLEDGGRYAYDMLVLATGARHNYFGNDAWAGDAPGLKKIDDATAIRCRLLAAFEEAETCEDPARRAALLTFVVVGGGPTGVEMAGAIAELAHQTLRREFRRIDTAETRILLVESGPRVLASFPESLSERALAALRRLGVEVRLGQAVTGCSPEGIELGGQRIPATNIVWAAGVAASPAGRWLGIPTDRAGRAIVEPDLTAPGHPEIMVLGDTAAVTGPDGRPIPGVAAAAKQMGRHAARQIRRRLTGQPAEPFRYRDPGSLATIGRNAAVARIWGMQLSGMPAWALWAVAHIWFLVTVRNRLMVALHWGWSWASRARPVRLITGELRPKATTRPISQAA